MSLKERIDGPGEADDGRHGADPGGNQDDRIQMSDPVHERGIEPQGHQQCGEAHPRRDDAQSQAQAAEHIPDKTRRDGHGGGAQTDQQGENKPHCKRHGRKSSSAAPALSRLPPQGGQHPGDQPHKQADRRGRVFLKKEGQQIGHPHKAQDIAQQIGREHPQMGSPAPGRIGQKLHQRPVDAEYHAEHAAADSRENGPKPDQSPL